MTEWVHLQLLVTPNGMRGQHLRLIQAMETYGNLWSISMFGSHASLTLCGARETERSTQLSGYRGENRSGAARTWMGGWGCLAADEQLLPAGSPLPLVTLFNFHFIKGWWIGNPGPEHKRMQASAHKSSAGNTNGNSWGNYGGNNVPCDEL